MQSVTDVRTCCIQLQNYKPKRHNITMGPNHGDMDLDLNLDLRVGDLDLDLDLRVGDSDLNLDLRPEDLTTSLRQRPNSITQNIRAIRVVIRIVRVIRA